MQCDATEARSQWRAAPAEPHFPWIAGDNPDWPAQAMFAQQLAVVLQRQAPTLAPVSLYRQYQHRLLAQQRLVARVTQRLCQLRAVAD
jgi:hypothetical protein